MNATSKPLLNEIGHEIILSPTIETYNDKNYNKGYKMSWFGEKSGDTTSQNKQMLMFDDIQRIEENQQEATKLFGIAENRRSKMPSDVQ
jgi:hypothetical protein